MHLLTVLKKMYVYICEGNKCRNWDKIKLQKSEKARWSICENACQKIKQNGG